MAEVNLETDDLWYDTGMSNARFEFMFRVIVDRYWTIARALRSPYVFVNRDEAFDVRRTLHELREEFYEDGRMDEKQLNEIDDDIRKGKVGSVPSEAPGFSFRKLWRVGR